MSIVKYKRNELPPLTETRKSELNVLSDKPDNDIDYNDIAPLDNTVWKKAVRGRFYYPIKT
ncbi:hypothetical protein EAE91_15345 [Photorhabdus noenieputensis]|uniref:hypothetical protein n=1 Tax=Photorhabdus noenieputensis TaxID=1208607 RepID=UPI001BD269CF|nr:hypothetical protein [Photorhabdus noenieputensis]MBS9438468.1 hypothetical protein [Photorhabdus noenieputensis]MCK3671093.1 hypothetical protein [Photorhabdus noenieputensis]